MTVALVATVPHAGHRLYEQRLAAALAVHTRVAYLEPPTSPRSWAALRAGGSLVDGGQTLVQPAWTVPFTRRLRLGRLREAVAARAAARAIGHLGQEPSAVVFTEPSGALRAFPRARKVLLIKDDYVAGAHLLGQEPGAVEARLRRSIAMADAVVAVSPVLRERLRRYGVDAQVIPAGCTPAAPEVGAGTGARSSRAPLAAFIGGVSPRVLPGHLQAVLDAGCDLVVVGGMSRNFAPGPQRTAIEALLAHPRVQWRGHVSADEVTAVLADADLGLVPYDDSSFNAASFPLKILEYLGAGLPVVSTPLPAVEWIDTPQIRVERDAAAFGAAAAHLARAVTPGTRAACRAVAGEHTWERRAQAWLAVLGDRDGQPQRGVAR
ncbi:glycosyltransferase [Pengzhenrongella sicca]|uniref:Glycosyltransferase n=1 Tax=Pengzhenrongella sicca TaxID=2819238 RepID=A0A8A4ZEC3_9MICO|nr:glycosyltransferase [Pengzhenrongella sicca]QTE29655.1 glycosyltransferase [Pengzhenrongella sicca]